MHLLLDRASQIMEGEPNHWGGGQKHPLATWIKPCLYMPLSPCMHIHLLSGPTPKVAKSVEMIVQKIVTTVKSQ